MYREREDEPAIWFGTSKLKTQLPYEFTNTLPNMILALLEWFTRGKNLTAK